MTPETAINGATTQTFAAKTQPVARIVPALRQPGLLPRRTVAVMTLPDGNELFMRETATGWTVIDYGTPRTSDIGADRSSDIAVLSDIAAAYGFGPLRDSMTPATKRPSLTPRFNRDSRALTLKNCGKPHKPNIKGPDHDTLPSGCPDPGARTAAWTRFADFSSSIASKRCIAMLWPPPACRFRCSPRVQAGSGCSTDPGSMDCPPRMAPAFDTRSDGSLPWRTCPIVLRSIPEKGVAPSNRGIKHLAITWLEEVSAVAKVEA